MHSEDLRANKCISEILQKEKYCRSRTCAEVAPTMHLEVLILPLECSLTLTLSPEFNKAIKTTLFASGGTVAGAKPSSLFAFLVSPQPRVSSAHIGAND